MAQYGNMEKKVAGQIADSGTDVFRESGRIASGDFGFGVVVVKGTTDETVKIAGSTTDKVRGISFRLHNGKDGYKDKDTVVYVRKGRIVAKVSETGISADDLVYVNLADAERRLCNDSAGNLLVPNAVFRSSDSNGLADVEINIP